LESAFENQPIVDPGMWTQHTFGAHSGCMLNDLVGAQLVTAGLLGTIPCGTAVIAPASELIIDRFDALHPQVDDTLPAMMRRVIDGQQIQLHTGHLAAACGRVEGLVHALVI